MGSQCTSNLAINSKINRKQYENIKCRMNNCRENMKSLYKYITINIAIRIVYPKILSKNETSSSRGITSPGAKSKKAMTFIAVKVQQNTASENI